MICAGAYQIYQPDGQGSKNTARLSRSRTTPKH
jgi:hypothetical protein